MRIVLDARMINNTGVGRIIQNLVIHLARLNCTRHDLTFFVNPDTYIPDIEGCKVRKLKLTTPIYSFQEQCWLPWELWHEQPELIHFPNFNVPLLQPCPSVVTVHDLVYYLYPEACPSKLTHLGARLMLVAATHLARRVITDSNHSKGDLVAHLGIPGDKITVIPAAVNLEVYHLVNKSAALDRTKHMYGITRKFILYVGNHEPRKNLVRLIRAFSRLSPRGDYQLVIGGKRDARRVELPKAVEDLGLEQDVIFTGFIPDGELPLLYNAAELFVFPSLYEGFGLPPLEAMACGTPVITSRATSLPEVVGGAAVMVDPLSVEELTEAMHSVLMDRALQCDLIQKGLERAEFFSWEQAARQTLAVYEEIVGGGR